MTILFDLDGTVIDSTEAILESFHNSYRVYDRTAPTDEAIKALIGHPLDVMYRELGIEESMVWKFVGTYKEYYREISTQKTVLLPKAAEAVIEASKIARLGIVTTKTAKYSRILMEHFGLMHYFDALVGFEDVKHAKPHAEPIEKVLELMGAPKENCWLIGDTRIDVEAAHNAAINIVAVTTGYDSHEKLSTMTDTIENDVLDAVRLIAAQTVH